MAAGFDSSTVWKSQGRGFQMGVIQHKGIVVHLTGQVAWDKNEQFVGLRNICLQTTQCLRNIEALLAEIGGQMNDIVAITTYFTDRSQLPEIQKVRNEFFQSDQAPASTSVMVAGLGHPDFLVELTPIAVIPDDRFRPPK